MKTTAHPVLPLLKGRAQRLQLLIAELRESQRALVHLDLDAIYEHNARQQALCHEVQLLDAELVRFASPRSTAAPARCASMNLSVATAEPGAETPRELRAIFEEHEAARQEVQQLSQVQMELLRRSRNSSQILLNLVTNSLGTYEPPRPRAPHLSTTERGT